MIEIMPIGGYREVGKNCTAIKVDDEIVILDMGLHMENYIDYTQDDDKDLLDMSTKKLIEIKAIPDITPIEEVKHLVKAICISHAHLDHVGAVPFLAHKFNCPIHATPYTAEVLKAIVADHKIALPNHIIDHDVNCTFNISNKIKIEFISVTHSTPHTVIIVVHTKYGSVVYANDYKFDNHPILGHKPNYGRLEQIKNVRALIVDSLYANKPIKTPSEAVARELLREVLVGTNSKGKAIIVSTFSSHIQRLKSIVEFSKQLNRKIVFLGRSLDKYVTAAEKIDLVDFSREVKIIKYGAEVSNFFKKCKKPEEYVFVVTGHQGEPKSVLARMIFKNYFRFKTEDIVIFSCTIIPGEENIINREKMEAELKKKKVRIFRDIHVSGHGAREDLRDIINMIKPEIIFPVHAEVHVLESAVELAEELGYRENKNIFILKNGSKMNVGK